MLKKVQEVLVALDSEGDVWPGNVTCSVWLVVSLAIVCAVQAICFGVLMYGYIATTARAEENLAAFTHAMQGRTFLVEGEWRAVFTCPAKEVDV